MICNPITLLHYINSHAEFEGNWSNNAQDQAPKPIFTINQGSNLRPLDLQSDSHLLPDTLLTAVHKVWSALRYKQQTSKWDKLYWQVLRVKLFKKKFLYGDNFSWFLVICGNLNRVSISMNPDQAWQSVRPNLGPSCFQKLSNDKKLWLAC